MPADQILALLATLGIALGAVVVVALPVELYRYHRRGLLTRARVKEMLASASPLVPTLLTYGVVSALFTGVLTTGAAWSPWSVPVTWGTAIVTLVVVDFLYYVEHWIEHHVRALWALTHSVHHSSPQFDQTTGLRVAFLDGFVTPWFYLPAVLIGLDPTLVIVSLLLVVGYQQWIHTEAIGAIPWLDGWLNTPANHRVHHAAQARYVDRNFGGILILWDRLFGTYQAELPDEPVRFGLTHPIASSHPWTVHVAELRRLVRDLRATPRWRDRVRRLSHGPGWEPSTSQHRAELEAPAIPVSSPQTTDS